MSTGTIAESRDNGVLTITLDRPEKRNALSPELLFCLAERISDPGDAKLVILRSDMPAGFSAGFDIAALRERGAAAHDGDPIGTVIRALLQCAVPTIAVLNGYCIGAAVEVVTACDLRIARRDLQLSVPANRMGAPYRPTGVDLLARRYGWSTAVELFVFGATLNAEIALARQLVSFIGDVDDLAAHLEQLCQQVCAAPAGAAVHRTMLAEWSTGTTHLYPGFITRWERVREEAVATRQVPDLPQPEHRRSTHV